jgi:hypothetical protein
LMLFHSKFSNEQDVQGLDTERLQH